MWMLGILFTLAGMLAVAPWGTLKVLGIFAGLCFGWWLLMYGLIWFHFLTNTG